MEQVRNARLDNLCESIRDHRQTMNQARTEEQADIQAALQTMQRSSVSVYRHGGIELARVPGAEKLRVRTTKEEGDADASDLEGAGEDTLDTAGAGEYGEERQRELDEIGEGVH